ncbi:MAG: toll/interleukin-1 receptor domain-containing protein [Myxococcales bacterium]|nr:toll/interleukin-1 receptor domain-containing protein [Myxococcales bacterium]
MDGLIALSDAAEPALAPSVTGKTLRSALRIFVSHAGNDAQLAKGVIDLIEAGLDVPTGAIRCTSVDGYRLDGGDDGPEVLRENLKVCSVVLGILTEASLASSYVLMELGAAWAFKKRAIPLIGAAVKFGDLPGPFKDVHALKIDHEPDMSSLVETLANETGFATRSNMPKVFAAAKALTALVGPKKPARGTSARQTVGLQAISALPASMNDDEAMAHIEAWLDQFAASVQGGGAPTPSVLDTVDIAILADVPPAKAQLVVNVAAQNEHFGVTVTMLQNGKFRLDVGPRTIKDRGGW